MNTYKFVCCKCGSGPIAVESAARCTPARALYRLKGALFHNGASAKGVGPLYCAACAPPKIKAAICAHIGVDADTKRLAQECA